MREGERLPLHEMQEDETVQLHRVHEDETMHPHSVLDKCHTRMNNECLLKMCISVSMRLFSFFSPRARPSSRHGVPN